MESHQLKWPLSKTVLNKFKVSKSNLKEALCQMKKSKDYLEQLCLIMSNSLKYTFHMTNYLEIWRVLLLITDLVIVQRCLEHRLMPNTDALTYLKTKVGQLITMEKKLKLDMILTNKLYSHKVQAKFKTQDSVWKLLHLITEETNPRLSKRNLILMDLS